MEGLNGYIKRNGKLTLGKYDIANRGHGLEFSGPRIWILSANRWIFTSALLSLYEVDFESPEKHMTHHLIHYHTYILRFWQERDEEQQEGKWRFTLMETTQGHRYGFSSLEDLMAFLNEQIKDK